MEVEAVRLGILHHLVEKARGEREGGEVEMVDWAVQVMFDGLIVVVGRKNCMTQIIRQSQSHYKRGMQSSRDLEGQLRKKMIRLSERQRGPMQVERVLDSPKEEIRRVDLMHYLPTTSYLSSNLYYTLVVTNRFANVADDRSVTRVHQSMQVYVRYGTPMCQGILNI